jgi:biotin-(acetyl-CoA carboxylase) ligase
VSVPALAPDLPPLLRGARVLASEDPLAVAIDAARGGADPGLLAWSEDTKALRAAVTLAPEMALRQAIGVVFAAGLGMADSLGALAPPETAVHLAWPNRIRVNGAECGRLRAAASTADPDAVPDWLVIGVEIAVARRQIEPGLAPELTALAEEATGITVPQLLEAWSRHSLLWINRFVDDGFAPLRAAWLAKCDSVGGQVKAPARGRFAGLHEHGGQLLETEHGMCLLPLTMMLEGAA